MGAVLSGIGICISPMSAMPRSPISIYSGATFWIFLTRPR